MTTRDSRLGEFSRLGRQGNPGRRVNFSSYKHFCSPNRDNSRYGEYHEMPRLRFKLEVCIKRSENYLGKLHCDRKTEGNSKKEGYLHVLLCSKGYE